MSIEEDIIKAKESLQNALGDKFERYMLSMKKWFSGKSSKQEFDIEARQIVTENFVQLHNEFLLCIITKCNSFSSTVSEASARPISSLMAAAKSSQKPRKKQKTTELLPSRAAKTKSASCHLRFVPVDPIKHAPSLIAPSFDTAHFADKDFSLEFCSRERSLPYFKMIHGRLLLGAIDHRLEHVDIKAVFLLAEATVWLLKNIVSKLSSRSRFKQQLRKESAYDSYRRQLMQKETEDSEEFEWNVPGADSEEAVDGAVSQDALKERQELREFGSQRNNPLIAPQERLPSTLFDLRNVLQFHRHLLPSHSIYTINMEKLMCSLWHEDEANASDNF